MKADLSQIPTIPASAPVPQKNNTLCAQPWVGLQVRPDRGLRPCCMFSHNIGRLDSNDALERYHHSPELLKVRSEMLSGQWPESCVECKKEEAVTGTSPRLFSPGFTTSKEVHESTMRLSKLEIFTSNLCNLDCVMCNPEFSSKWNPLIDKMNQHDINFLSMEKYPTQRLDFKAIDSLFERARGAHEVLLLGGEPLANKDVHDFIERWANEQCEGQLTLITNATLLEEKILRLLARCKNVHLTLSIDAFGPLFEWIRGVSWNIVEKKIFLSQQFIPNLVLSPTMAAYNIGGFEELFAFSKKNNLRIKSDHILVAPYFLNFSVLSKDYCLRIADRIEALGDCDNALLIDSLRNTPPYETDENSLRFIKWCNFFNQQRGINLFDSFFDKNNLN